MFKKAIAYRKRRSGAVRDNDIPNKPYSNSDIEQKHGAESPHPDPLGLKVVHRPTTSRRGDIIFVHGLGGSSQRTWSRNGDPTLFWPGNFLPIEPNIKEARILTFGYNSNFGPGSGKSIATILDFAKDLLYDMKYAIDETSTLNSENLHLGERPIIFVAHSMGGLIVKEAFIQGQNDPAYSKIFEAVTSIVFLSTPHRGTSLAEVLNRILRVSFVSNPKQFIAELSAGSQSLEKLNEQFRHIAPKLEVFSFYETRPTSIAKTSMMVLEKDSSILGYPGEVSKPLDGDHHDVCKFSGLDDPRYVAVRNALRSLLGKTGQLRFQDGTHDPRPVPKINLQDYLSTRETPQSDYHFFRGKWVPGTCEWILDNELFTSWLDDLRPKPRVLWIHGSAASGKSILSSFIIDHLNQRTLPCHYFFIRFIDRKKRMISTALRSLAFQLANSDPAYAQSLGKLVDAIINIKEADCHSVWKWLFKQALFQLEIRNPIFLIVDGVDEADSPDSLIRLLVDLSLTSIPLRILLVSRKTHEISSGFSKLGINVHVDNIPTKGNVDDFRSYIQHEIDIGSNTSYLNDISSKLLQRANGNFLWLHLAVQKMNQSYTIQDVERAMDYLPSGMEALYDRMMFSIQSQPKESDRQLAHDILSWACCAQRPMRIEELSDALANSGVLEIHRTIGDLCGGFVVVDNEGKVTLVHETAREYLIRRSDGERSLTIDEKLANYQILRTCIARLTDPLLRSQVSRNQQSALLDYVTEAWFIHFAQSPTDSPEVLKTIVNFLNSPHILTWIYIIAKQKELKVLTVASRHITDVALEVRACGIDEALTRRSDIDFTMTWATDLVKIVGKFGNSLRQYPNSIYKLIPPFCPQASAIYRQFGSKKSSELHVSGSAHAQGYPIDIWDDCLTRFVLDKGAIACSVVAAGNHIAVLANVRKTGCVTIYQATTFEEQRRVIHPERVLMMHFNRLGSLLVSYGYMTTRVWDTTTGGCIKTVRNPLERPRPQTLHFSQDDTTVLVVSQDRCVRSFQLTGNSNEWAINVRIDEQRLANPILNFPTCSALSPDGNMIAFGYRSHPATCWELEPLMLMGQCNFKHEKSDRTIEEYPSNEVIQLAWNPLAIEVIGLDQVGLLFKWDPYNDEASLKCNTGADRFTLSQDGSLTATGDALGTIKILATADFSLLYRLSSQDSVTCLSFSIDSRRLYDVRLTYANVWEPNTLVRLADSYKYLDNNGATHRGTDSIAKFPANVEHHSPRVDSIITLASQTTGPLYCYGTENGVAYLGEVGRGRICELERMKGLMSIMQIAWSDNGQLVALVDLAWRLSVKRLTKTGTNPDDWDSQPELNISIPPSSLNSEGHVDQLMFHSVKNELLVTTCTRLLSVNLISREVNETPLLPSIGEVRWLRHPKTADYILGFGVASVRVVHWATLKEVVVYNYSPPRSLVYSTEQSASSLQENSRSLPKDTEKLGRLFSNADASHVLLQISRLISGQVEMQYLIFDIAKLGLGPEAGEKIPSEEEIPYTLVPACIASRIREPLTFLSNRRLVFLDIDRWICSWRLPVPHLGHLEAAQSAEEGIATIEQYYFLPGDWVTADEVHLYSMMSNGILLCPRNGDIATVQSVKLRR